PGERRANAGAGVGKMAGDTRNRKNEDDQGGPPVLANGAPPEKPDGHPARHTACGVEPELEYQPREAEELLMSWTPTFGPRRALGLLQLTLVLSLADPRHEQAVDPEEARRHERDPQKRRLTEVRQHVSSSLRHHRRTSAMVRS